jgi:hypothetical protein
MSLNTNREYHPVVSISIVVIAVLALVGWVLNLAQLFSMGWTSEVAGMIIVRVIGVFIPFIGSILGYV